VATVQRFEDLEVWKDARELVKRVYQMSENFPSHEMSGLTSQIRRAAVSVMSNIAEGFERGANTEFIQFLFVARASCGEVPSHSYVVLDLNYASQSEIDELREQCAKLSRRIKSFIEYLKHSEIKGHKFRDEQAAYIIDQPET